MPRKIFHPKTSIDKNVGNRGCDTLVDVNNPDCMSDCAPSLAMTLTYNCDIYHSRTLQKIDVVEVAHSPLSSFVCSCGKLGMSHLANVKIVAWHASFH